MLTVHACLRYDDIFLFSVIAHVPLLPQGLLFRIIVSQWVASASERKLDIISTMEFHSRFVIRGEVLTSKNKNFIRR